MLKVFYYYYYLFYSKVLVQPEPHFVTVLVISFIESIPIMAIMDFVAIKLYCTGVGKWPMIAVIILFNGINYLYFSRQGKGKEVVKEKPKILGSHTLTVIVTLSISLICLSWLFWGAVLGKQLLEACQ